MRQVFGGAVLVVAGITALIGCGSSPSAATSKQRYITKADARCRATRAREAPTLAQTEGPLPPSVTSDDEQRFRGEASQTLSGVMRAGVDQLRSIAPPINDRALISHMLEQLEVEATARAEEGSASIAQGEELHAFDAGKDEPYLRDGQRTIDARKRREQAAHIAAGIALAYGFKMCGHE